MARHNHPIPTHKENHTMTDGPIEQDIALAALIAAAVIADAII
jgi:hypothetical protein